MKMVTALVIFMAVACSTQPDPEHHITTIRQIMDNQVEAWNQGSLEGFMNGYLQSDQLEFIGKRGRSLGWQTTLNNYKAGYPDQAAMGNLSFTEVDIRLLSHSHAYVVGRWAVNRSDTVLSGWFTLLWQQVDGDWVIISDHSS